MKNITHLLTIIHRSISCQEKKYIAKLYLIVKCTFALFVTHTDTNVLLKGPFQTNVLLKGPFQTNVLLKGPFQTNVLLKGPFQTNVLLKGPFQTNVLLKGPFQTNVLLKGPFQTNERSSAGSARKTAISLA